MSAGSWITNNVNLQMPNFIITIKQKLFYRKNQKNQKLRDLGGREKMSSPIFLCVRIIIANELKKGNENWWGIGGKGYMSIKVWLKPIFLSF